jgi:hypothetical protein
VKCIIENYQKPYHLNKTLMKIIKWLSEWTMASIIYINKKKKNIEIIKWKKKTLDVDINEVGQTDGHATGKSLL